MNQQGDLNFYLNGHVTYAELEPLRFLALSCKCKIIGFTNLTDGAVITATGHRDDLYCLADYMHNRLWER